MFCPQCEIESLACSTLLIAQCYSSYDVAPPLFHPSHFTSGNFYLPLTFKLPCCSGQSRKSQAQYQVAPAPNKEEPPAANAVDGTLSGSVQYWAGKLRTGPEIPAVETKVGVFLTMQMTMLFGNLLSWT